MKIKILLSLMFATIFSAPTEAAEASTSSVSSMEKNEERVSDLSGINWRVSKKSKIPSPESLAAASANEGILAAWEGDLALAEAKLSEASRLGDNSPSTLSALAWTRIKRGDELGAWVASKPLISKGSEKNALAALRLADKVGQTGVAVKELKKRPSSETSEAMWAWTTTRAIARGDRSAAEKICPSALEAVPDSWRVALACSTGNSLAARGAEAVRLAEEAEALGAPKAAVEKALRLARGVEERRKASAK